jgi:hypothetical protein
VSSVDVCDHHPGQDGPGSDGRPTGKEEPGLPSLHEMFGYDHTAGPEETYLGVREGDHGFFETAGPDDGCSKALRRLRTIGNERLERQHRDVRFGEFGPSVGVHECARHLLSGEIHSSWEDVAKAVQDLNCNRSPALVDGELAGSDKAESIGRCPRVSEGHPEFRVVLLEPELGAVRSLGDRSHDLSVRHVRGKRLPQHGADTNHGDRADYPRVAVEPIVGLVGKQRMFGTAPTCRQRP